MKKISLLFNAGEFVWQCEKIQNLVNWPVQTRQLTDVIRGWQSTYTLRTLSFWKRWRAKCPRHRAWNRTNWSETRSFRSSSRWDNRPERRKIWKKKDRKSIKSHQGEKIDLLSPWQHQLSGENESCENAALFVRVSDWIHYRSGNDEIGRKTARPFVSSYREGQSQGKSSHKIQSRQGWTKDTRSTRTSMTEEWEVFKNG